MNVLRPQRKQFWWDRIERRWQVAKRIGERSTYTIDLSDRLLSGETASSVASSDVTGVTVHTLSVTGAGVLTVEVTGVGSLIATVTSSGGEKIELPLAFISSELDSGDSYA